MAKNPWLGRFCMILVLVCFAVVGLVSCNGDSDNGDNGGAPPAGQPGTVPAVPAAASPSPVCSPSSKPSPGPTKTGYPYPKPYPVPVPIPVPYPYPVPVPVPTQTQPQPPQSTLQEGAYGGQDITITVASDQVDFEFACARGEVPNEIEIDDQGNFDTNGTYELRDGPVPRGGFPVYSARYFGNVSDGHIHFDVAFTDDEGNYIDQQYDAVLGAPTVHTRVCALVTPSASPSPSLSPQPSPTPPPQPSPPPPPAPSQNLPATSQIS